MKFGKSAAEVAEEPPRGEGGSSFIRYLRQGDNTFRILQDPDEWIYYWEHFNPGGFAFPCTNDRASCPGCTSKVDKMKGATRMAVFHGLVSMNDVEYVNVYKVPSNRVGDLLKNRFDRNGTLTDRDYTITKIKLDNGNVAWDIEGTNLTPINVAEYKDQFKDIEQMLADAYEQSWGDPVVSRETEQRAADASTEDKVRSQVAAQKASLQKEFGVEQTPPPSEPEVESAPVTEGEDTISESDLRKMTAEDLKTFCEANGWGPPPPRLKKVDSIVDWMMQN